MKHARTCFVFRGEGQEKDGYEEGSESDAHEFWNAWGEAVIGATVLLVLLGLLIFALAMVAGSRPAAASTARLIQSLAALGEAQDV